MYINALHELLEKKYHTYNQPAFIENDPISVPHKFCKLQDIEISAFWTAMLSWGLRKTIINKALQLFELMDNSPHNFILNHSNNDLKAVLNFKHRTFNTIDTLYFIDFFKHYYSQNYSLETAFSQFLTPESNNTEAALIGFHKLFFSLPHAPLRTQKHIATPQKKATCKRLNMFLRWLIRTDKAGVDFGIWKQIKPHQLLCPVDVHVERIGRQLGLIKKPNCQWHTTLEITNNLRLFDPNDPVKYDFALFGMGVTESKWKKNN